MKELNFLNKLIKQGKIKLVDSSDDIKKSYIEKSESNLISSKILNDNDKLEESIALSYYSMYNLVLALLFKIGIKCENHSGSILLLKLLFEIDNSEILEAKKERIDKQYYTDFEITKKDVVDGIIKAEKFNSQMIDYISKIINKDIEIFRNKFNEMVN